MNKLWIVTFETFLRQIKSWGFVMLVIGPFLMFGITVGAGYLGGKSGGTSDEIAVISQQSQLRDGFAKANKDVVMNNVTDKKTATKKMDANKLAGYLVLKIDNNRVTGQYFGTKSLSSNLKVKVNSYLNQIQQQLNLTNAQLSKQQLQSLQQKSQLKETIQEKAGTNNLVKTISYWITVMMVYIILITYTTITAQEIASEKGTKIMEIIFSSTTAIKYFLGKIFGILLVILTQILIYLVGGWGIYIFAQNSSLTRAF